jgi:DNA mismatch repair ATPase MutS
LAQTGLVFEYHLEPGPATTRNAIALLQMHGAPDEVVTLALARRNARSRAPASSKTSIAMH